MKQLALIILTIALTACASAPHVWSQHDKVFSYLKEGKYDEAYDWAESTFSHNNKEALTLSKLFTRDYPESLPHIVNFYTKRIHEASHPLDILSYPERLSAAYNFGLIQMLDYKLLVNDLYEAASNELLVNKVEDMISKTGIISPEDKDLATSTSGETTNSAMKTILPRFDKDQPGNTPERKKHVVSSWFYACDKQNSCKIFTYVNIPKKVEDDPDLHAYVLAVHDDSTVTFEEVWDVGFHNDLFSDRLPIAYTISKYQVVQNKRPSQFSKNTPIYIKVSNLDIKSDRCGSYCQFSDAGKIENIADNFKSSSSANVYGKYRDWKTDKPYNKTLATLSLMGFTMAYQKLNPKSNTENSIKEFKRLKPESAIDLIRKNIKKNKLGVKGTDLLAKKNEKGDGYFVYVKNTQYSGYERLIVWYVIGDNAMKLNSPSSMITPELPWSREIQDSIWDYAGFDKSDATREALSQVFGGKP